jgi:iron(II)-dependent oxidoreductase
MDLHLGRPLFAPEVTALLTEARARTLLLLDSLTEEDLRLQHDPLMSPIVWDLAHIGHFEEVWLRENLRSVDSGSAGLRGIYNPFENPRATRDGLELPTISECRDYLAAVRRAVLEELDALPMTNATPLLAEGFVFRMVLQHEYQHNETILQTLQLKQGDSYPAPRQLAGPLATLDASPALSGNTPTPGSMVRFPGGVVTLGTDDRSAAYDNERPAHEARLDPFWMDAHPVTNAEYAAFVAADGYSDPVHWSKQGWAWKEESALVSPKYWSLTEEGWVERSFDRTAALDPNRPVAHVCYWEAEAFSRWAGKRLPTEAEWEVAAGWNAQEERLLTYPWGDEAPGPGHANLDALLFETTPIGSYERGRSPLGCWDMLGNVWEWTSTDFHAYPGYETFPYPEYSEVFFGREYKVLKGGAWATRFGSIRNTFRNWDYPVRRQIFSGMRCAKDD